MTVTNPPRPISVADSSKLSQSKLKKLCSRICKAEGLPSTWVRDATMAQRRDWLSQPVGTHTPDADKVGKDWDINYLGASVHHRNKSGGYPKVTTPPVATPKVATPPATTSVASDKLAEFERVKKLLNSNTLSPAAKAVETYCRPNQATQATMLIGPSGSGKTYAVRTASEQFDKYVEYQAKDSEQETTEMLGGTDGSVNDKDEMVFRFLNGEITEAWRHAANGHSVMLCLDEFLRLRKYQRDCILSALQPWVDPKDGQEYYVLKTAKAVLNEDGDYVKETIKAPKLKLAIVATSNTGTDFQIEDVGKAEAQRFFIQPCPTDWDIAEKIFQDVAKAEGWDDYQGVAKALKELGKATTTLEESCELWQAGSVRTIRRALERAYVVPNHLESLRFALEQESHSWVDKMDNGLLNTEQLKTAKIAIETHVSTSKITSTIG